MSVIYSHNDYIKTIKSLFYATTVIKALINNGDIYLYDGDGNDVIIIKKEDENVDIITDGQQAYPIIDKILDVMRQYLDGEYLFDVKNQMVVAKTDDPTKGPLFSKIPISDILYDGVSRVSVLIKLISNKKVSFSSINTKTGFCTLFWFVKNCGSIFINHKKEDKFDIFGVTTILKSISDFYGFVWNDFSEREITEILTLVNTTLPPFHINAKTLNAQIKKFRQVKDFYPEEHLLEDVLEIIRRGDDISNGEVILPFTLDDIHGVKTENNKIVFDTSLNPKDISVMFDIDLDSISCVKK